MTKEQQKEMLFKVFNVLKELEFPMNGIKAKMYSEALEALGAVHNALASELKEPVKEPKGE